MSTIAVRYDGDVYELIVDDAPVIAPLRARVASLEAEVLRLRNNTLAALAALMSPGQSAARAPTPEAPPSKSVQRRLAAQGAPTSGQGEAATAESVCVISGKPCPESKYMCRMLGCQSKLTGNLPAPAPAAQPATEVCGTCKGAGEEADSPHGGPTVFTRTCGGCGGLGTTPRKATITTVHDVDAHGGTTPRKEGP